MRSRGTRFVWFVLAVVLLCAADEASAQETVYVRASHDGAEEYSGCGPDATGGPWDPAAVEVGTGSCAWGDLTHNSVFVDPAGGLEGSPQGLQLRATAIGGVGIVYFSDASAASGTSSGKYWLQYSFRLNAEPEYTDRGNAVFFVILHDSVAAQLAAGAVGWNQDLSDPDAPGPKTLRYSIYYAGGSTDSNTEITTFVPSDEFRVVIEIDSVGRTQRHRIWKNGHEIHHEVLDPETPYALIASQPGDLHNAHLIVNNVVSKALVVFDRVEITNQPPLEPPRDLRAIPKSETEIRLRWLDASPNESGFRIERSDDGIAGWTVVGTVGAVAGTGGTVQFTDSGLVSRTKYHYRVHAYNASEDSLYSNATWATTVYTGYPLSSWIDVTDPPGGYPADKTSWADRLQWIIDTMLPTNPHLTSGNPAPHVVYFPNGTYELDHTVFMEGRDSVQFVGESPENVVLLWTGPSGNGPWETVSMFHSDGNFYAHFRNLIWDAGGDPEDETKGYVVAFDQAYCGNVWAGPYPCLQPTCTGGYNLACDDLPYARCTNWAEPDWLLEDCEKIFGEGVAPSAWTGLTGNNMLHMDSTFRNAFVGYRIGHYNVEDDELTVRRCRFLDNFAGVSIEDANALQETFWDVEFANNRYGITNGMKNTPSNREDDTCENSVYHNACTDYHNNWAGDFRVFRGRFRDNYVDMNVEPTGSFTIRDSQSKGSGQFLYGTGPGGEASAFHVINCEIDDLAPCVDHDEIQCFRLTDYPGCGWEELCDADLELSAPLPTGPEPWCDPDLSLKPLSKPPTFNCENHEGKAIELLSPGPLVLVDNRIDSTYEGGEYEKPVFAAMWTTTDVFAIGNEYTASEPYDGGTGLRLFLPPIEDSYDVEPFDLVVPALPVAEDKLKLLPVFTVTDGNNFQGVLDAASEVEGGAIVHLPSGRYDIATTLRIGPGSKLLVAGDGTATTVHWAGALGGVMLEVDGHEVSGLTIRDLRFAGGETWNPVATGIVVGDLNQEDSRALVHKVAAVGQMASEEHAGFVLRGVDRVAVDLVDAHVHADVKAGTKGLLLEAGPQEQEAKVQWTGCYLGNDWDFDVVSGESGVKFLWTSTYMEHSVHSTRVRAAGEDVGPGEVTAHCGRIATGHWDYTYSSETPYESILVTDGYVGNVSVVGDRFSDYDAEKQSGIVVERDSGGVDIQMIGNIFHNDSSSHSVTEATQNLDVVSQKFWCPYPNYENLAVCNYADPDGSARWVSVPDEGSFPADDPLLVKGMNLLRTLDMPKHYDEPLASKRYQVNFDNLYFDRCQSGIVLDGGIPGSPSGLTAAASEPRRVELAWTDTTANEDGFRIERAPATTSVFVAIGEVAKNATAYSDTTVQPGVAYSYRVASFRERTGPSGYSNTAAVMTPPEQAEGPNPRPDAPSVKLTAELSWKAGVGAVSHDVYFGTNSAAVASASRTDPQGVLVSQAQKTTKYDPYGSASMAPAVQYHWRIDEVASDGTTIQRGVVWSFTTAKK